MCARGSNRALLGGPSTHPLDDVTRRSGTLTGAVICAWLAVLAAAFLTACVFFAVTTDSSYSTKWSDASGIFALGIVSAEITAPFAFVAALLVGLPILHWLYRNERTSLLAYLAGGTLMSLVSAVPIAAAQEFGSLLSHKNYSLALWIIVVSGPIAALTARRVLIGPLRASSNNRWRGP